MKSSEMTILGPLTRVDLKGIQSVDSAGSDSMVMMSYSRIAATSMSGVIFATAETKGDDRSTLLITTVLKHISGKTTLYVQTRNAWRKSLSCSHQKLTSKHIRSNRIRMGCRRTLFAMPDALIWEVSRTYENATNHQEAGAEEEATTMAGATVVIEVTEVEGAVDAIRMRNLFLHHPRNRCEETNLHTNDKWPSRVLPHQ